MTANVSVPAEDTSPGDPVTSTGGLSHAMAGARLKEEGANILPGRDGDGLLRVVWSVLREPMFLLLLAAGTVYLVMGEAGDAAMLLGFVVVIMTITILQERRTGRAMAALRNLTDPHAQVIRNGRRQRIPARNLVRGDLIVISEGERIPADAVLREAEGLRVDESLLTGESVPVSKVPGPLIQRLDQPGGDGLSSLFSGSLVIAGQGVAQVLTTGPRTELGRMGQTLSLVKPERSRLQQETGRLVRNLAIVGVVLCSVVVVAFALTRGGDVTSWRQGLLAGITLAMALLPEEFPVILTIFLALGAWRIAQARVLTRRMPAIETLGATTVLCTDKTGTLTLNRMALTRANLGGRTLDLSVASQEHPDDLKRLLETAVLASRAAPFDPMEVAILAAEQAMSAQGASQRASWALERTYPLTAEVMAMSQVWRRADGQSLLAASKGAPEAISGLCGLTPQRLADITADAAALAGQGLRVLGIAQASIAPHQLPVQHRDLKLEFLGLIGLEDPLRPGVPAAVAECRSAGIRVMMITGDFPATAQVIAHAAGIADAHLLVTGPELARMDDAELAVRVRSIQVFARVAPQQKLRLVQALKSNHEVVAMTGDGVNDAPALKAAHIGIAMGGRGSEVARESAGLVLLDDDFASIVTAIRLGRRIFDNIKKAVSFTFAVHVPIAGLSILPVFMTGWPLLLLPVHIVFLELVIDPSCTLIYEAETEEGDLMTRPPRDPEERLFAWRAIAISLLHGGIALAGCIGVLIYAHALYGDAVTRGMTFITLVTAAMAIILVNRSWSLRLFQILAIRNRAQGWVLLGTTAVMTVILSLPMTRRLFHFAPIPGWQLVISIAVGLLCLVGLEAVKRLHRHPGGVLTGRQRPSTRQAVTGLGEATAP